MLANTRKVSGTQLGFLRMSIPPALAANVGIYAGSKVAITTEKGKMVLSPIPESSSKASGTGLVRKNFIQPKRSK